MNKKIILILISVIVIILFAILFIFFSAKDDAIINKVSIHANHVVFEDVDNLTKESELIIIGRPVKEYSDEKSNIEYYTDMNGRTAPSDFSTKRNIEILEIIKGDYNQKSISVIEPYALIDGQKKGEKTLLFLEDCPPMEKGQYYILFIKKNTFGDYGLISSEQGKFNIDNLDVTEKEITDKNEQYRDLKTQVLEKYKQQTDRVLLTNM